MNIRKVLLGAFGVTLLTPVGLRAASFGDLAGYEPQPGQPTHAELAALAAQAPALEAQASAEASLREPGGEPSYLVTTYATRALCEASMTTPVKIEDFDSTLRTSSLWSCCCRMRVTRSRLVTTV